MNMFDLIARKAVGLPAFSDDQIATQQWRNQQYMPTGTIALHGVNHEYGSIDQDVLWEMMYIKPKPVIIVCGYCNSHNAVTNPACVQCGAPMGSGRERVYG